MAQPLYSSGVFLSQETQFNSTLEFFSTIEADNEKVLRFLGLKKHGFAGKLKLKRWGNNKGAFEGNETEESDIEEHIFEL